MDYNQLIEILLSENVYENLKKNETEIFSLIPEFKVCKGFDQKNSWHVYDVYEHILHVVSGVEANRILRIVALFHDTGKPLAFKLDADGIGHFFGHWEHSADIFSSYAAKFNLTATEIKLIDRLIFYHDVNIDKMTDDDIFKMINEIGADYITYLFAIKRADLLAQASQFHGLLSNIQKQEERILSMIK